MINKIPDPSRQAPFVFFAVVIPWSLSLVMVMILTLMVLSGTDPSAKSYLLKVLIVFAALSVPCYFQVKRKLNPKGHQEF